MAKINGLDKMSLVELRELSERVAEAIIAAEAAEKRAFKDEIEALAAKRGLTIADILGTRPSGRGAMKGTKVAVKYRNPKDPSQTWTGRGRQPNWLVDALKKGQKIENFAV